MVNKEEISSIINLAITVALNGVEKKILNLGILAKIADYDAKISEIEHKYLIRSDYIKLQIIYRDKK